MLSLVPSSLAPAEPHLSVENDKQGGSCEQISVWNESGAFQISEMREGSKDGWASDRTRESDHHVTHKSENNVCEHLFVG